MAVARHLEIEVSSGNEREDARTAAALLSRREGQVLELVSTGASNEEIAAGLGISVHTVKSYVKAIFLKVGARNRTAAATWFERVRNGTTWLT